MRHSCHDRIVRRTLVVLGLAGLVSALCHGADYPVHVVEPAVTNHMILRDGPLPPVCREATAMEVSAGGQWNNSSGLYAGYYGLRIAVDQLRRPDCGLLWQRHTERRGGW